MKHEFESRAEVVALPTDYSGDVITLCQSVRIRNLSTTAPLTIDVSGTPFEVPAGSAWGYDTGDVRAMIVRPIKVQTGTATALVERIVLSPL